MLTKLIFPKTLKPDESRVPCCPPVKEPCQPPSGQDPDCCYDTWQFELDNVNKELAMKNKELSHITKHLAAATDRYNRLSTWNTELVTANDLAIKICAQLDLIYEQLIVVCRNTEYTKQGIEYLICMIRDFYITVDELQIRYDRLINCIKCLNNPALSPTQGIYQCLSNYGTALSAIIAMRDSLIQQVMLVYSYAVSLHEQICDEHGYKRLIAIWKETLGCHVICDPLAWGLTAPAPNMPDPYWLDPILNLPICADEYVKDIHELYKKEKKLVRTLTDDQTRVTREINHLTTIQSGLTNGIKEVLPSVRCS